jgi:hypothetical protein
MRGSQFPSVGIRMMLVLIACAPLLGALLAYATGGGSLAAALILGTLMTVGTCGFAWWLAGKTGTRDACERARTRAREDGR